MGCRCMTSLLSLLFVSLWMGQKQCTSCDCAELEQAVQTYIIFCSQFSTLTSHYFFTSTLFFFKRQKVAWFHPAPSGQWACTSLEVLLIVSVLSFELLFFLLFVFTQVQDRDPGPSTEKIVDVTLFIHKLFPPSLVSCSFCFPYCWNKLQVNWEDVYFQALYTWSLNCDSAFSQPSKKHRSVFFFFSVSQAVNYNYIFFWGILQFTYSSSHVSAFPGFSLWGCCLNVCMCVWEHSCAFMGGSLRVTPFCPLQRQEMAPIWAWVRLPGKLWGVLWGLCQNQSSKISEPECTKWKIQMFSSCHLKP